MSKPFRVLAWAVLTPKDDLDKPEALRPYGNGFQWQYPIFGTRKDAQSWRDEDPVGRGRIVRVRVEEVR